MVPWSRYLMVAVVCSPPSELVPEVFEVAGLWWSDTQLVNDRQQVVEAGDGLERRGVCSAEGSTGGGEDDGVLDGLQVYAAVV